MLHKMNKMLQENMVPFSFYCKLMKASKLMNANTLNILPKKKKHSGIFYTSSHSAWVQLKPKSFTQTSYACWEFKFQRRHQLSLLPDSVKRRELEDTLLNYKRWIRSDSSISICQAIFISNLLYDLFGNRENAHHGADATFRGAAFHFDFTNHRQQLAKWPHMARTRGNIKAVYHFVL